MATLDPRRSERYLTHILNTYLRGNLSISHMVVLCAYFGKSGREIDSFEIGVHFIFQPKSLQHPLKVPNLSVCDAKSVVAFDQCNLSFQAFEAPC